MGKCKNLQKRTTGYKRRLISCLRSSLSSRDSFQTLGLPCHPNSRTSSSKHQRSGIKSPENTNPVSKCKLERHELECIACSDYEICTQNENYKDHIDCQSRL